MERKLISIMTPCYNEEENVEALYLAVKQEFAKMERYEYEHVFIDNNSTDGTQDILRRLAGADKNVKVILNSRNFGQFMSPYYGLLQSTGDAVISMACDFQDPPDMICKFIERWEQGFKIVIGVKSSSKENKLVYATRTAYYKFLRKISDTELVDNFTGFGLYDKTVIEILKKIDEPLPFIRGLICEIGFEKAIIQFEQPLRIRGLTKNNVSSLYDAAMLGVTSYSRMPLRIAAILGFIIATGSILVAITYFIIKLIMWDNFLLGQAPNTIGLFFFGAVQLFFIGILGEYIGIILVKINKRPLVIERERINFEKDENGKQG